MKYSALRHWHPPNQRRYFITEIVMSLEHSMICISDSRKLLYKIYWYVVPLFGWPTLTNHGFCVDMRHGEG